VQEVLDYKFALKATFADAEGNVLGNAGPTPFWRHGSVIQDALFEIAEEINFDWTTNLNQYNTKILFCYSELDEAYGLEYAQLLSSSYPNVQLEIILGSGHNVTLFGWDNFYPIAKNYLTSLK
jgi:proline iminopeptidase